MKLRSMLFVPGDSERKIAKAMDSGADAIILDLEDSVALENKAKGRDVVRDVLARRRDRAPSCYVRVNALDSGLTDGDLDAALQAGIDGIVVPKADGLDDVAEIARRIDRLEVERDLRAQAIKLVAVATETPRAMFNLGSYALGHARIAGLTWGAEDLSAAIGATSNVEPDGSWTNPYQLARSLCLFAAASAQILPLDTLYSDFRDAAGLERDCRRSRRDGFMGRMAIHPDQIAIINESYSPGAAEIEHARRIVSAFTDKPGTGTVGIDGRMYDIPHLKAATRLLATLVN